MGIEDLGKKAPAFAKAPECLRVRIDTPGSTWSDPRCRTGSSCETVDHVSTSSGSKRIGSSEALETLI